MEIHRGDIVYIEKRNDTIGHEQYSGRPAVVVSNDKGNMSSGTVEVVYLTTQPKHDIPTHVQIRSTGRLSTALCEQIWTISTERIGNLIGSVTEEEMAALEEAILISLGVTQNGGGNFWKRTGNPNRRAGGGNLESQVRNDTGNV